MWICMAAGRSRLGSHRGCLDPRGRPAGRTPGYHLVALDAHTGREVESFGTNGVIDLKLGGGVDRDGGPLKG